MLVGLLKKTYYKNFFELEAQDLRQQFKSTQTHEPRAAVKLVFTNYRGSTITYFFFLDLKNNCRK